MKLKANTKKVPLAPLILIKYLDFKVPIEWCEETKLLIENDKVFSSEPFVFRYFCNKGTEKQVYGTTPLQKCEVDSWITFSLGPLSCEKKYMECLSYLDTTLSSVTYLVGNVLTAADVSVWSKLVTNKNWNGLVDDGKVPKNIYRWFSLIGNLQCVKNAMNSLPAEATLFEKKDEGVFSTRKEEGKFVELPGAETGKVIVRFPPEASGYLHIGHAKAALLNQYYRDAFKGKLIMRFDDTNPAKEKVDFEKVILEDLQLLKVDYDIFSHTSDHFDLILEKCEFLLKSGKAYVDDTDPEIMKQEREQKLESKNRNNNVEKNIAMWSEMKAGTEKGQKCCVRAKIDMQSLNGCMRDPTIYRCKNELHPKTGSKYKVYPTYDFACPIVDSIEGVTHSLRTMEYHDRDEQFFWFIDALGLRKPYIWEYSRLNMTNTVLSKRKLTWFVENGHVDGWDDPRMPTVRGVLRRGMTVEGLKQFITAQGSSRSVVVMEWDKIWAINKKVIDPVAPRYTAVDAIHKVPVIIEGVNEQEVKAMKHPKNPDIGEKNVWLAPKVWIDEADAILVKEGENITLINWGNVSIKTIMKKNDKIEKILAIPNFEDKNYKKTLKLTWLADTPRSKCVECICVYYDFLISKPVLGKDEDFKKYISHNTKTEVKMIGDPELANVKKSEIIQLQRKGFFICDVPYSEPSIHTGREKPIVLFFIPDGHTKEMPTVIPTSLKSKEEKPVIKSELMKSNDKVVLNQEILEQGNKVRHLKQQKADKKIIDDEVKKLLQLKDSFKSLTGQAWKPDLELTKNEPNDSSGQSKVTEDPLSVHNNIVEQGNKVRTLKQQKAEKSSVDEEVSKLLKLKGTFKSLTGLDWKPDIDIKKFSNSNGPKESSTDTKQEDLNSKISALGDKIRHLKSEKADKAIITEHVQELLSLKAEYKSLVGKEWTPSSKPSGDSNLVSSSISGALIKIKEQGDKIRKLKSDKAAKNIIETEVKTLLGLKNEYKELSGKEWTPDAAKDLENKTSDGEKSTNLSNEQNSQTDSSAIESKIKAQGDLVRNLKTSGAAKESINEAVQKLLSLKADYKILTGKEFISENQGQSKKSKQKKENAVPTSKTVDSEKCANIINESNPQTDSSVIESQIKAQGDLVRNLKTSGAAKETINEAVQKLLSLKADYKSVTGKEFISENQGQNKKSKPKKEKPEATNLPKNSQKKESSPIEKESSVKKITRLGIEFTKEDNLPEWYSQVITKGELIEYYDVSGCYILRPWSFAIWEVLKEFFDKEIKQLGVKNCYFPIFVSRSVLEKEKDHIEDFAPEVAWVTKSGESDLAEHIAIRPTSETVMYPAYAKWIQSYRDLPIKLNQWNNVVRWEFKHPQPFLRTREFLWQEGHTAYADKSEAEKEVKYILGLYERVYTELLAIPVIKGVKTVKEKFAGGEYTFTVEAYISASGRAIQGATSHHLGQNFSKMFEIVYEDPETQEKKYVFQNSWGFTTRTIGVMIMVHSDNKGLVLPPRVASVQVVIVPCGITASLSESEKEKLLKTCRNIEVELKEAGIKVEGDYRDNYSPGWKFNHWELKGVPIRVEVGPKDLLANQIVTVRRDTGARASISMSGMVNSIKDLLDNIQESLLQKATKELNEKLVVCKNWKEFCPSLDNKCLLLSPFCGEIKCEEEIKEGSTRADKDVDTNAPSMGAKSLCIPFEQPKPGISDSDKCINPKCSNKPKQYTLFGRSY
ncbi:unnamed protein product [Nezara viridula]|uniref:Prolyl-tRNA synthetase n=1 Tax=Nezara viridula TaxID=85310 RepID=A0A9P0H018_NEZVI|nr:unnamed protein product [Nezara viridula]